jgi:hypothetical protein
MILDRSLRAREKLVGKLPVTGELRVARCWSAPSDIPKTARNARVAKGTGCLF